MGNGLIAGDSLFTWTDGVPYFRGLRVVHHSVSLLGRSFSLAALDDASALLDHPDYAQQFLAEDMAPYGLELWPAGIMLAEHVLSRGGGAGRRALELGCGLGLTAIAATLAGWRVTAVDHEETSVEFARYNAAQNGVAVETFARRDWRDPPRQHYDLVLAADVLYQLSHHAPLLTCIANCLGDGAEALVADPNRGVADGFDQAARAFGFDVSVVSSSAADRTGKLVEGRIFRLQRAERGAAS